MSDSAAKYVNDQGVNDVEQVQVVSATETPSGDATTTTNVAANNNEAAPTSPPKIVVDGARVVVDSDQQMKDLADKPKSLFVALVFKNPFHEAREECDASDPSGFNVTVDGDRKIRMKIKPVAIPKEDAFRGYAATKYAPATFMRDDDFLKVKRLLDDSDVAPNIFQKVIGLLVRLKRRGLTVIPGDMLEEGDAPPGQPWNHFHGFRLNESKMFLSPDKDECYVKIHADREVLLDFAERQALTLRTNPYSFGGGGGMIYTRQLDEELRQSVVDYMFHYDIPEEDAVCAGKLDKKTGKHNGWGFAIEVPQKMRMLLRMMKEGWQFGGAGLQLDEMKGIGDFLINYFPLHNLHYQEDYEIDKWGSLLTVFNPCSALADWEKPLIQYFGENIALYFSWLTKFCWYLFIPGCVGVAAGILQLIGFYPALMGGGFAVFLVGWAVIWIREWVRYETKFSLKHGQYIEAEAELTRDQFEFDVKRRIDVRTIYTLDFEFPLTMQRLPDGTMVELFFPASTRSFRRYAISYPMLTLFAGAMGAGLFFTERLRVQNIDDGKITIAASIVSVLITTIFTKIATILIELLNNFENCRTDTEYDNETVMKAFAFNFIATYWAIISLAMWPGIPDDKRVDQIRKQMALQSFAMPFLMNLVEIILPKIMTSLRKRRDRLGGMCAALCSYVCCCCVCEACRGCRFVEELTESREETEREKQAMQVWREAQLEPYASSSDDYLEIMVQTGYMMMFAAAFPFAAMANFINYLIEIRIDAHKLVTDHQRPVARIATSIGAWNDIFWILLALSVVTNSYYIIMIEQTVDETQLPDRRQRLEWFTYLQYLLVFVVIVFGVIRNSAAVESQKTKVKQQLLHDRIIQEYIKSQLALPKEQLEQEQREADALLGEYKKDKCC